MVQEATPKKVAFMSKPYSQEEKLKKDEQELEKLKDPYNQEGLSEVDTQNISKLQNEIDSKLKDIYLNLDPWQTTLVARHEDLSLIHI